MDDNQGNGCSSSDVPIDSGASPDPELIAEGWEFRFIADTTREREAVDLYSELGYEVKSEPARTGDLKEKCKGCRSAFCEFFMIYTRER